jgi:hypothetical protein
MTRTITQFFDDFTIAFTSLSFCCYVRILGTVTCLPATHVTHNLTPTQLQHYQRKHYFGWNLYKLSCFSSEVVLLTIVHILVHLPPIPRLQHKIWQYIGFLPHVTFFQTSSSILCATRWASLWKSFIQRNESGFTQPLVFFWYHWFNV